MTKVTITLEPWQIAGLILLILSLAVILRRLAILIVLELTHLSSVDPESLIGPVGRNLPKTSSNDDGSVPFFESNEDGTLRLPLRFPNGEPVHSGSTGYTPGSVSYIPPADDSEGRFRRAKARGGRLRPTFGRGHRSKRARRKDR